jgi:hypothetical protein
MSAAAAIPAIASGVGRCSASPARTWKAIATRNTKNFIGALAKAQHNTRVRDTLAAGFRRTRPVAALLDLGSDQAGEDAGGLVLALFNGLLFQMLLDPELALEGDRLQRAQARLRRVLPERAE